MLVGKGERFSLSNLYGRLRGTVAIGPVPRAAEPDEAVARGRARGGPRHPEPQYSREATFSRYDPVIIPKLGTVGGENERCRSLRRN